ncbi:hypothetical protein [Thermogemmatispora onikobensis]|uniref:hypothetical protein n=1 Tax=Thermogemmatispora onikobensis TaxID=732234 RepID=UPI00085362F9|nr:hypothetical protein [Thermogemmatispora onikobensis]
MDSKQLSSQWAGPSPPFIGAVRRCAAIALRRLGLSQGNGTTDNDATRQALETSFGVGIADNEGRGTTGVGSGNAARLCDAGQPTRERQAISGPSDGIAGNLPCPPLGPQTPLQLEKMGEAAELIKRAESGFLWPFLPSLS